MTTPAPAPVKPGQDGDPNLLAHIVCTWCNPGPRRPGQRCLCGHITKTSSTFDPKDHMLCVVCADLAPAHGRDHANA